ncbi:hypothetical protein MNV_740005 [Candidatus Methanoperedens nitroreducens]|uniref:Uncharacterized protein n=1 Tax=Candidatus Methanoperedens nitratireducens TaxID=1392998 RepID=A0A284VT44_9EURY|nr:hypothetical protein MNV_740005 [Candidatus Methanoperedens nitroreducens]
MLQTSRNGIITVKYRNGMNLTQVSFFSCHLNDQEVVGRGGKYGGNGKKCFSAHYSSYINEHCI